MQGGYDCVRRLNSEMPERNPPTIRKIKALIRTGDHPLRAGLEYPVLTSDSPERASYTTGKAVDIATDR